MSIPGTTGLSEREHRHRLEYAERQWEHFRLRVLQAQCDAQLAMLKGDAKAAERKLEVARRYIEHVDDCNQTINAHRRAISPSTEDLMNREEPG